jgi:hypothetical protein
MSNSLAASPILLTQSSFDFGKVFICMAIHVIGRKWSPADDVEIVDFGSVISGFL